MIDISAEGETLEACAEVLQAVFGYEAFRGPQCFARTGASAEASIGLGVLLVGAGGMAVSLARRKKRR